MIDLLSLSIGIGLVVSLFFSEVFGLAAGGMVVPGYFAIHMANPVSVLLTLLAAFGTFAIVHTLGSITIVYGRRRTVLMILVGYLLGAVLRQVSGSADIVPQSIEVNMIGHIIPGLIAIWMDRQGVLVTLSSLVTAAVVTRLILILTVGSELRA